MKLARYRSQGLLRSGLVLGEEIVDCSRVWPPGPQAAERFWALTPRARAEFLDAALRTGTRIPLASARLCAPTDEPRRFIAVGLNYRDHAREMGQAVPTRPRLFVKLAGALSGPTDPVPAPAFSPTLDYEGELALVIGRRCRNVRRAEAREVVAGFLVLNDLSVREYVNPDLLILGKGCAGFAPCGPWLTTVDEIEDPHALALRTWVNGELRQSSTTGEMIFDCWELIERITRAVTLEPGDLITTGSPPGSGIARQPPSYLRPGDVVRVEIAGLGALQNAIVREPQPIP
jgi:2-keto-4-pentenoate hydratase/2-oxohepta-3-ene-1,7-dioic acid hydratase in catechol pathway